MAPPPSHHHGREKEYHSFAACPFEQARVEIGWKDGSSDEPSSCFVVGGPIAASNDATQTGQPCVVSPASATIRLMAAPNHKNKKPWKEKDWHFSPHLRLLPPKDHPLNSPKLQGGEGLLCTWQAKAREGLAVTLSPTMMMNHTTNNNNNNNQKDDSNMYQVIFGSHGNTQTKLVAPAAAPAGTKKTTKRRGAVVTTTVSSHVCSETDWTSYWICLTKTTSAVLFYAGVGKVPGKQCCAILQVPISTTKGDADGDETSNTETKKTTVDNANEDESGNDNGASSKKDGDEKQKNQNQGAAAAAVFNFYLGFANTAQSSDRHASAAPTSLQIRNICLTAAPPRLLEHLETSLLGTKVENVAHLPLVVLDTADDETKQLFANHEAERVKSRARSIKFGVPYQEPDFGKLMSWSTQRRLRTNPTTTAGFVTGLDLQDPAERAKQQARQERFGTGTTVAVVSAEATASTNGQAAAAAAADVLPLEQAWDNEATVQSQRTDPPRCLWKNARNDNDNNDKAKDEFALQPSKPPVWTRHKIHMFSIDWAAFKQIRTTDVMSYCKVYGPTYVEWLGDYSCNVQFADEYSASRALQNLSLELPSPVPESVTRVTTSTKDKTWQPTDLGARGGWRLGKTLLQKIANDKYGRRGTRARVLMRVATSLDVLQERPSSWPPPPPGFTTKRILGPTTTTTTTRRASLASSSSSSNGSSFNDDSFNNKKKNHNKNNKRLRRSSSSSIRDNINNKSKKNQKKDKKRNPGTNRHFRLIPMRPGVNILSWVVPYRRAGTAFRSKKWRPNADPNDPNRTTTRHD